MIFTGEPQPGAAGQGLNVKLMLFRAINDRIGFMLSKNCCIIQNPSSKPMITDLIDKPLHN